METGRKFWVTAGVEAAVFAIIVLVMFRWPAAMAVTVATIGIPAMATLAATFIAGNAAISWQAIKSDATTTTVSDATTRTITERRSAHSDDTEDTP